MLKTTIALSFLLFSQWTFGQQLFNVSSTIEIHFTADKQAYFIQKLNKGQGVKGLPQVAKKTAKEILKFNGINTEKPVFADKIKVPLNVQLIVKSKEKPQAKSNIAFMVPVFYVVKKGETLFKIASQYNDEDVIQLMKRNKLKDNHVKSGMKIQLGWLPIEKAKEDQVKKEPAIIAKPIKSSQPSNEVKKIVPQNNDKSLVKKLLKVIPVDSLKKVELSEEEMAEREKNMESYVSTKGIAIWQQSHKRNSNKFVLHDKAAINSTILLYNPMAKKSIAAKVIGRIPEETYNNDVDIVLSSGAASSLGALDNRFMIEMKYKR